MYAFTLVDSVTDTEPGSLLPTEFTLHHWRFLWDDTTGRGSVWVATFNTFIFASATAAIVCATSLTSAYALSRLNFPARRFFLAGVIILHAFPTITLIIAIFLILQFLGLFDTLIGVIMVKAALELPFGIWVMKGFYDTVPWEIEMAGVQDGASRLMVWRKLVLPQVQPGLSALLIFSFLSGWSEFILPLVLAPGSDAQVLSTYLAYFLLDDSLEVDFNLFKSVGLFYALPVILIYLIFQKKLMNIYGGGSKG
jgi:inositol-phosphate transport system permease protein